MEQIIRLGFHGVLSNGRQATAVRGSHELRNAIDKSGEQVQVIVGGGVWTTLSIIRLLRPAQRGTIPRH